MKNIIYKLIKRHSKFYDFITDRIVEDKKIELIEKLIGDNKTYSNIEITELDGNIENCILVNVVIKDSEIKTITNCIMEKTILASNNFMSEDSYKDIRTSMLGEYELKA